jgi:hypothetical protein
VGVESIAGVVREGIEDRGVKFIYLGVLGFVCFFLFLFDHQFFSGARRSLVHAPFCLEKGFLGFVFFCVLLDIEPVGYVRGSQTPSSCADSILPQGVPAKQRNYWLKVGQVMVESFLSRYPFLRKMY